MRRGERRFEVRAVCECDTIAAQKRERDSPGTPVLRHGENLLSTMVLSGSRLQCVRGDFFSVESSFGHGEQNYVFTALPQRDADAVQIALIVEARRLQK